MSPIATGECLAELVSDLSEAFTMFSNEAVSLSALLAHSEAPVSPESYHELQKQCAAEVQAFEEYLNRKEEILSYLKVESRQAQSYAACEFSTVTPGAGNGLSMAGSRETSKPCSIEIPKKKVRRTMTRVESSSPR
jgi:hypothetical protein